MYGPTRYALFPIWHLSMHNVDAKPFFSLLFFSINSYEFWMHDSLFTYYDSKLVINSQN